MFTRSPDGKPAVAGNAMRDLFVDADAGGARKAIGGLRRRDAPSRSSSSRPMASSSRVVMPGSIALAMACMVLATMRPIILRPSRSSWCVIVIAAPIRKGKAVTRPNTGRPPCLVPRTSAACSPDLTGDADPGRARPPAGAEQRPVTPAARSGPCSAANGSSRAPDLLADAEEIGDGAEAARPGRRQRAFGHHRHLDHFGPPLEQLELGAAAVAQRRVARPGRRPRNRPRPRPASSRRGGWCRRRRRRWRRRPDPCAPCGPSAAPSVRCTPSRPRRSTSRTWRLDHERPRRGHARSRAAHRPRGRSRSSSRVASARRTQATSVASSTAASRSGKISRSNSGGRDEVDLRAVGFGGHRTRRAPVRRSARPSASFARHWLLRRQRSDESRARSASRVPRAGVVGAARRPATGDHARHRAARHLHRRGAGHGAAAAASFGLADRGTMPPSLCMPQTMLPPPA